MKIPDGYWNIVCYNDNTENLMFRDTESWHGFTAVPKGVTAPDDEPCVYAPDMLFGYSIAECALTRFVSKSSDKIVLTPLPMTGTYSFEITGIRGLKNIAEISGSLSGMGKSLTMSSDTIESAGTLYFPGKGDKETDIITGEFRTFDHIGMVSRDPNTYSGFF